MITESENRRVNAGNLRHQHDARARPLLEDLMGIAAWTSRCPPALELAWQGAKAVYLSFDIDVIDSGFVPGTGWPEPGGLLPREALALVRGCAEGGLSGMEIVECSPPYDWAEQTSLISARIVLDTLASLVRVRRLGNKAATRRPDAWGPYPGDEPRDPSQNYPAGHFPLRREGRSTPDSL